MTIKNVLLGLHVRTPPWLHLVPSPQRSYVNTWSFTGLYVYKLMT